MLVDFFGSFLLIAGKSPANVLGLGTPKITITPFPTLVLEEFKKKDDFNAVKSSGGSSATSIPKININQVNFKYQDINQGQSVTLGCQYNSNIGSSNLYANLVFINQLPQFGSQGAKNMSYFVFSQSNFSVEQGDKNISLGFTVPSTIPQGKYKAILNLYSNQNSQLITNCVTDQFSFHNPTPLVVTGLSAQLDDKIVNITDSSKVDFTLQSFGNFTNLKPQVIITGVLPQDNKIYYQKDLDLISLSTGVFKTVTTNLGDANLKESYLITLKLTNQQGVVISTSPTQGVYFGAAPEVTGVTTKASGDNSYNVKLTYNQTSIPGDRNLEIYTTVCSDKDCDFGDWYDLANGWPASLTINKPWDASKNKISVRVRFKGLFQRLIFYKN